MPKFTQDTVNALLPNVKNLSSDSQFNIGLFYHQKGNIKDAIKYYKMALYNKSNASSGAAYNLGCIFFYTHENSTDFPQSKKYFEIAKELGFEIKDSNALWLIGIKDDDLFTTPFRNVLLTPTEQSLTKTPIPSESVSQPTIKSLISKFFGITN